MRLHPRPDPFRKTFRQKKGLSAYRQGLWAEQLCCWILRLKFYRILARRYQTPMGEIDIIATRGDYVAIVEVKARTTEAWAREAISHRQQQRLGRAAQVFLARHPHLFSHTIRFDIMTMSSYGWPTHQTNAFNPIAIK